MKFLTELFNRLRAKSPAFFKVLQVISAIIAFVSGLPLLLATFETDLGVNLPSWVDMLASKAVTIAAIVAWVIAKLPIKETVTPPSELPYTKAAN